MKDALSLVLFSAALLSSILISCSILVHIVLPKLRRSPGHLILILQICQLAIDLTLIISLLFPGEITDINSNCEIFSGIFTFTILFSISTSICLKTEIYIQLHAMVSNSYTKRNKLYYCIIFIFSSVFEAVLITTKSLGSDEFSYCSVKNKSVGEYFIYCYLSFDTIFMWIFIIYVKFAKKSVVSVNLRKYINLLTIVSILVTVLDVLLFMNMFYENIWLRISASVFLLTGVNLGTIFRIFDSSVIRELKWRFFRKKMRKKIRACSSCSESPTLVSDLLVDLRTEGIDLREGLEKKNLINLLKILACLSLRFEALGAEVDRHEKYKKFFFSEKQFFEIASAPGVLGIENCKTYIVYNPNIGIIDYKAEIFEDIRRRHNIGDINLIHSFFNRENIKKLSTLHSIEGGKSESFIFNTKNRLFTIKLITENEVQNFLLLLPYYYKRIKNTSSKLVRIYGLFKILPENINILLMQNLIPYRKNNVIFDLKGSQQNRIVPIEKFPIPGIVLKDQNFKESKIKISLNRETESLLFALKKDFEVLQNCQLVDYSMIIAINISKFKDADRIFFDDRVTVGVIDFLQTYNFCRKAEHAFKMLRAQKNFSMIQPQEYCKRISLFLSEVFEIV